ncbi:MAG: DOMON-like domain-containing protein [Pseudomonadota bacterium]
MTEIQGRCEYHFQLRLFGGSARNSSGLALGGVLERLPGVLSINYLLDGDLSHVLWPAPANQNFLRKHELWRQTCFEIFFGIPGDSAYWEMNLCPNGCWNLYHFTGYRRGMQEEAVVDRLTSHVGREGCRFHLSCRMDMHKLVPDYRKLEVGIAVVVFDTKGTETYWAIDHLANKPDFHNRRCFKAVLSEVAGESCLR